MTHPDVFFPFSLSRARIEKKPGNVSARVMRHAPAVTDRALGNTPEGASRGAPLLTEGKPLRCARCGGEEWQRDGAGRRACAMCAGGDARVAAPPVHVRPESTSRDVSEEGGAA
jgi:hypothetical protein